MKWKVSNTLFLLAGLIFALGVLFNWFQVKNSVETSLEKARRVKKEKAEQKKKEKEQEHEQEINEEIVRLTVSDEEMLYRLCEITGVQLPNNLDWEGEPEE